MLFNDGKISFLGEYCGAYSVYEIDPLGVPIKQLSKLNPGRLITFLNKKKYVVTSLLDNESISYEGEFTELPPDDFVRIELSGDDKAFALVNIFSKDKVEVFSGKYFEFDEFKFTQLRSIDAWK